MRSYAPARAVVCAVLALACAPERASRTVLVGIDGASFRVVGPLLEEGHLPHLASIAARGVRGELQAFLPLHSPRIWNTLATGQPPERHGIVGFFRLEGERRRLYDSGDRRAAAIWTVASRRGRSVGVVNWWTTFPAEAVNGVMISDHLLTAKVARLSQVLDVEPAGAGRLAHPGSWVERSSVILDDDRPLTGFPDPFGDPALPRWHRRAAEPVDGASYLSQVYAEDTAVTRLALAIQAETDPDLLLVLLPGVDRVSHVLWGVLEREELYEPELRPTPAERQAGIAAIHAYYEYVDALLGRILEGLSERDTVLVVSDHGFEATRMPVELGITGSHGTQAASKGILFAMGPAIPAGATAGDVTIHDVLPTLMAVMGLPVAEDLPGRPAAFLEGLEIERVARYADPSVEPSAIDSSAEQRMIDNLRALGYGD